MANVSISQQIQNGHNRIDNHQVYTAPLPIKSHRYGQKALKIAAGVFLTSGFIGINSGFALAGGYTFTAVATQGEQSPDSQNCGSYTGDFETSALNNRGEVAFVADLSVQGQGVFIGRPGNLKALACSGQTAPGGSTFTLGILGRVGLNDSGDAVFTSLLEPFIEPYAPDGFDSNSGVYRFLNSERKVQPLLVPGTTPAPEGGKFLGTFFHTSINNQGEALFTGLVNTNSGRTGNGGIGAGLYLANKKGKISAVVKPGDFAPDGGTFDAATNGWINDRGDVAFGGHIKGEECITISQSPYICGESVYWKNAATGRIQSIAYQGENTNTRCDGKYRLAFGGVINNRRDIVFIGDLTPATDDILQSTGVFLYSKGTTTAVACPGDRLPGGGTLVTAANSDSTYHLNNSGDVAFSAQIENNGVNETGVYIWSKGRLSLVAKTGTVIPGVDEYKATKSRNL